MKLANVPELLNVDPQAMNDDLKQIYGVVISVSQNMLEDGALVQVTSSSTTSFSSSSSSSSSRHNKENARTLPTVGQINPRTIVQINNYLSVFECRTVLNLFYNQENSARDREAQEAAVVAADKPGDRNNNHHHHHHNQQHHQQQQQLLLIFIYK